MATSSRGFTIIDAEQRSPEWHAARAGRVTGSRAADMLATVKSGEAAARRNLRTQLVLERITGRPQESGFTSAAMQQGIDREPEAYAAYAEITGRELTKTGFLRHDLFMVGVSLDGHVGDFEGIIEIKCPLPATHLSYLRSGVVPSAYIPQVTHSLWITGAEWCDFISYNPDFPEPLQVKITRVYATDLNLPEYQIQLFNFLSEVDAEFDTVQELMGPTIAWKGAQAA